MAAPARSLNFIIRALSLPSVLRPIDPAFLISRPGDCVSVTEATLEPQSRGPQPSPDAIRLSPHGSTPRRKLIACSTAKTDVSSARQSVLFSNKLSADPPNG